MEMPVIRTLKKIRVFVYRDEHGNEHRVESRKGCFLTVKYYENGDIEITDDGLWKDPEVTFLRATKENGNIVLNILDSNMKPITPIQPPRPLEIEQPKDE